MILNLKNILAFLWSRLLKPKCFFMKYCLRDLLSVTFRLEQIKINMKKPWKEGFPAPMLWKMQKLIFNFARNAYWSKNNRSHGAGRPNFLSRLTTIYLRYTCKYVEKQWTVNKHFHTQHFLKLILNGIPSSVVGIALSYKAIKSFKMLFGWWVSFDQVAWGIM